MAGLPHCGVVFVGKFAKAPDVGPDDHVVLLSGRRDVQDDEDHIRIEFERLFDEGLRIGVRRRIYIEKAGSTRCCVFGVRRAK